MYFESSFFVVIAGNFIYIFIFNMQIPASTPSEELNEILSKKFPFRINSKFGPKPYQYYLKGYFETLQDAWAALERLITNNLLSIY